MDSQQIKSILKNKNDRRQEEVLLQSYRFQNYNINQDSSTNSNNYNVNSRPDSPQSFSLDNQSFMRRQDIMRKLKSLIQKKGGAIFKPVNKISSDHGRPCIESVKDCFATLPPFDFFMNGDSCEKQKQFFKHVQVGDLVIAVVSSIKNRDLFLQVLCMDGKKKTYIENLKITGVCYDADQILYISPDPQNPRSKFLIKDLVRCEILQIEENQQRLILGMHRLTLCDPEIEKNYKLGAVFRHDLPQEFLTAREEVQKSINGRNFNLVLEQHKKFNYPINVSYLAKCLGILDETYTLMSGLRNPFEAKDSAIGLRKVQNSRFAYSYSEAAICDFRNGDIKNAFENTNKALYFDQGNAKALVILGGLYLKEKKYLKAVEKFEEALTNQPTYAVAKKYLIECLLEMVKRCLESTDYESAFKNLIKCLELQPGHQEVRHMAHDVSKSFDKLDKSSMSFECLGNTVACSGKLKALLIRPSTERKRQPSSSSVSKSTSSTSSKGTEEKKKVVFEVPKKSTSTEKTNSSSSIDTSKKVVDSKNSSKVLSLDLHELDVEVAQTWNTLNGVLPIYPKISEVINDSTPLRNVTYKFDEFANLIITPPVPIIKSPVKESSVKCPPPPPPLIGNKKFVMTFTPTSKSVQEVFNWDSSSSRSSSVEVNVNGSHVQEKSKSSKFISSTNSIKDEMSSISSHASTKNSRETYSDNKQSKNKSLTERNHRSYSRKRKQRRQSKSKRRSSRFRSRSKSPYDNRKGQNRFSRSLSRGSRSPSPTRRNGRFRSRSPLSRRRNSRSRSRSLLSRRNSRSRSRSLLSKRRNSRRRSRSRSPVKKEKSHQRRSRFSVSKSRSPSLRRSSSRTPSYKSSPRGEFIRSWGLPKSFTPSRRSPTTCTPRYERNRFYRNPSIPPESYVLEEPSPLPTPTVDYYTPQPSEQNNMIYSSSLPPCPGYYPFQQDISNLNPTAQVFPEYNQDYYQQPQDFQGRGKGKYKRGVRGRRGGRFQDYF